MKSISQLSKETVSILAKAKNPDFIINSAKEQMSAHISSGCKKLTKPENNIHWDIVYREGNFFIEQNNKFHQYRLIGNGKTYFSILKKEKLELMLSKIIEIGTVQNSYDLRASMSVYQVVVDEGISERQGCKIISLNNARIQFPESSTLASGFYTVHPCNEKALTPIENYFGNLALDRDNECVVLLGKMGAKRVRISRIENNERNNKFSGGAKTNIEKEGNKDAVVKVDVGSSILKHLNNEMNFEVVFHGVPTNISSDLLSQSVWFKNDPQLNGLLESLLSSNPPKEWDFEENIDSTFNFDFNVCASILGIVEANLKEEFKKISKVRRKFHVEFE